MGVWKQRFWASMNVQVYVHEKFQHLKNKMQIIAIKHQLDPSFAPKCLWMIFLFIEWIKMGKKDNVPVFSVSIITFVSEDRTQGGQLLFDPQMRGKGYLSFSKTAIIWDTIERLRKNVDPSFSYTA